MNLSKINKSAISGALMLLGFASLTSCTDDNDWSVDASYDRLFHSIEFSVTPLDDRAEVSFKKMPNTDYYIVEYSTDSLYNDIPMGGTDHSVVDSSFVDTPDSIYNLDGNTEYYIRIKGRSLDGKSSNWKYLDKFKFKTKAEQIITGVDVTSTTATVSFIAGKTIDAVYYYKSSEDSTKVDFTAEDVAAGKLTITGLKANSSYKVKLWNKENLRGTYSFKTTEAYPEGYDVMTLAEGEDLGTILEEATSDKVVIVMPKNATYQMTSSDTGEQKGLTIPANIKSIYFWGTSGAVSTWKVKEIKIEGAKDLIRFYNLNLENKDNSADYIINLNKNDNIGSIQFEKCNIKNTRGIIRLQKGIAPAINSINFKDCQINKIGSYGVLAAGKDTPEAQLGEVNLTNSTIANLSAGPMIAVANSMTKVNVDHCTLYDAVVGGKYLIDTNKNANIIPNVSNTLIGQSAALTDATATSYKNAPFVDVYYTNEFTWKSKLHIGDPVDISSAELWVSPSTGNFTIQDKYQSKYGNFGDPRWIVQ